MQVGRLAATLRKGSSGCVFVRGGCCLKVCMRLESLYGLQGVVIGWYGMFGHNKASHDLVFHAAYAYCSGLVRGLARKYI